MEKGSQKIVNCPTEFTLKVLGGKSKTVVLCYLMEPPLQYAELRQLIPKLSDKMLTEHLHDFVDSGLVLCRKADGKTGEVYVLAPKGQSLGGLPQELYYWGQTPDASFGVSVRWGGGVR